MNRPDHNFSAAEIAAAAFYETFPDVELLGGKRTSLGFSFDLRCPIPLPAEVESLIEEKMRQIVREKRPIRVMEMVPFSARELLLKEGHVERAASIEEGGLVQIVQIGQFYDLSPGPHLENSSQLGAFKLWPIERLESDVIRLSGCAYPSKEELKKFLKRLRDYGEISHAHLGVQKSFWRVIGDRVVWLSLGIDQIRSMCAVLREHLFQGVLEISLNTPELRQSLHLEMAELLESKAVAEIYSEPSLPFDPETALFGGAGGVKAQVSCFPPPGRWKENVISSLQLTEKTLNILGFQHRLRLKGRRKSEKSASALLQILEFQEREVELYPDGLPDEEGALQLEWIVEDQLGRPWPAISMEIAARGFFILASVERLVALLIEKKSRTNER